MPTVEKEINGQTVKMDTRRGGLSVAMPKQPEDEPKASSGPDQAPVDAPLSAFAPEIKISDESKAEDTEAATA
jgi:hypothetical protein